MRPQANISMTPAVAPPAVAAGGKDEYEEIREQVSTIMIMIGGYEYDRHHPTRFL
jgi:hypothetical protein